MQGVQGMQSDAVVILRETQRAARARLRHFELIPSSSFLFACCQRKVGESLPFMDTTGHCHWRREHHCLPRLPTIPCSPSRRR